ncbi:hypothetical protein PMAA_039040 [Talaromyces marneffei ATCC 18224]|uniref:Transcription activator GCR1-like domain-containing protein n=2 Tax=Talaromyces marneffei TaxID=37727 RepID=B6QPT2_TALMQ|nr:hypothetical protein PMAA_039040 [Talaromyces marneffei ATCC 18224]
MPSYQLSRTIQTVRELWTEWAIGLDGQPAVRIIEEQYGARWRADSKERVMFGRRKIIIDEIYARTRDGISLNKAIEAVELIQSKAHCTLSALSKLLKEKQPFSSLMASQARYV